MTLDTDTRDLLAALVDLEERLRDADDRIRSGTMARVSGVLRGLLDGTVTPTAAMLVLAASGPVPDPVAVVQAAGYRRLAEEVATDATRT